MKNILYLLFLPLFFSSCTQRLVDFTIISSKNIELSKMGTFERANTRVEGTDSRPIIVIVPLGYPDGKEALDKAIESYPGAVALVDGVFTYKWFYIPYIYGKYKYVIEGTPLYDPALKASLNKNLDNYSVCILDKNGKVDKTIQLEKNDFYKFKSEVFKNPNKATKKLLKTIQS